MQQDSRRKSGCKSVVLLAQDRVLADSKED